MQLNRRTFQQLLLLAAGHQLLPIPRAYALLADWRDLAQPFAAQVQRLLDALLLIGEPLPAADSEAVKKVLDEPPSANTVDRLEAILQKHVLIDIQINPESRVSVTRGAAKADLVEQGWRSFLLRVNNQAKDTSKLQIRSPQALPMGRVSGNETVSTHDFTILAVDPVLAESRWMALNMWDKPPLQPTLSGLEIEYRILQIYSRDHGQREASLEAVTDAGIQDLGFRSTLPILFNCAASQAVKLRIHDSNGLPATASMVIRDKLGRIYPTQSKRALPDLWFQPQIYRADGETLSLPDGTYSIEYGRGPEYLGKTVSLKVHGPNPLTLNLPLERWVDPSRFGYYSGDTHIHASGCSHYESPSEGVTPEVMLRQVAGQALDVGAVLTWAPGWLYQSQFFDGQVHRFDDDAGGMHHDMQGHTMPQMHPSPHETQPTLRYDLEVSGFPSSHCGHLLLEKLTQQNYPGTTMPDDWPSWNLPILKWAKSQGAITGYGHSGWGMVVDSLDIPNYLIPAFDSCGANEYLVDITHQGMLDFISGCDLWPFTELNLWYHVLNCGFALRFAGETDFPCITDKSVGGGRSYVKLDNPPIGDDGYDAWLVQGLQQGHSYFGDGRSHIFGLRVEGMKQDAELHLDKPAKLRVAANICARLEPVITRETEKIHKASPYKQPYWHLERSRIGSSRKVPVQLVVNGEQVQQIEVEADGTIQNIAFDLSLDKSSWFALRIMPSAHTNPIFVLVGGRPIRPSRRSAEWCRQGVDACWKQKSPRIRPSELEAAKAAYDHARAVYDRIISETSA
jgi:hypothetical protein